MSNEPAVIVRHYDLLRWLIGRVAKYPRDYRFTLGDRTVNLGLEVLEHLLEAAYSRSKTEPLRRANLYHCSATLPWRGRTTSRQALRPARAGYFGRKRHPTS